MELRDIIKNKIVQNNIRSAKVYILATNGVDDEEVYFFNTENGFEGLMFFVERNEIVTLDDKYNLPEVMVSEQGTKSKKKNCQKIQVTYRFSVM